MGLAVAFFLAPLGATHEDSDAIAMGPPVIIMAPRRLSRAHTYNTIHFRNTAAMQVNVLTGAREPAVTLPLLVALGMAAPVTVQGVREMQCPPHGCIPFVFGTVSPPRKTYAVQALLHVTPPLEGACCGLGAWKEACGPYLRYFDAMHAKLESTRFSKHVTRTLYIGYHG